MGYMCLFQFWFLQGIYLGVALLGLYGGFIPSFLRNLHNIFHTDCINLHSHQQCKSVPFSPHPLQHLLFVDFLMMAILTAVRWDLTVVLICISLTMGEGNGTPLQYSFLENPMDGGAWWAAVYGVAESRTWLKWLSSSSSSSSSINNGRCWASFHVLTTCISSLEKCLFSSLAHFLIGFLLFWYWAVWVAYIFWGCILCQLLHLLLFFSHSEGCLFTLLTVSFAVQKVLSLIRSHLFTFVFISITLGGGHRGSCCDLCQRVFCLCFPLGVL